MTTSLSGVEGARAALCAASARGQGGRAALRGFSDCVDQLLQGLFAEAPGGGAGDGRLLDRIAARVRTPAAHARILDALKPLIDERHARFNDTFYQLEPDIKDAPGALRDLWAARTIAALTDPALLDRGQADRGRLDEAEEFLLRVRSILHVAHKRNKNVLNHEIQ